MNIWIFNHYARPGSMHAGVAKRLEEAGHRVTLFAGDVRFQREPPVVDIPAGGLAVEEDSDGVRFRYVRTRPFSSAAGRLANMLSYRRNVVAAAKALTPPDVVVGSCVHPFAVDAAMRVARRCGAAFVYQIRDIWPATLVDGRVLSRWNPLHWWLRRLEKRAFRCADGVTGVMPGIVDYAAANGVPQDRVRWLPNGIDPRLYPAPGSPPSGPPFVVSYFGAHGPPNGLHVVIDAAARLQNAGLGGSVVFRFVGDGVHKPQLVEHAARLGLKNVEFHDPVPREQLASFARQSQAFMFTHPGYDVVRRYGLSCNKLCDYLLAARPIVFAADSRNNPVAEAGAGISIAQPAPEAIADAVVRLMNASVQDRHAMGQRGREYALQHHDLSTLAERWGDFLAQAVAMNHVKRKP